MTINPVKVILIILVLSNFISCNGQVRIESKQIEIVPFEIGKTVYSPRGHMYFNNPRGVIEFVKELRELKEAIYHIMLQELV